MIRAILLSVALLLHTGAVYGATAPDLRSRIIIDGSPVDFEDDEWVLDSATAFRERPGDSRWGRDNEVEAIAVTWDNYNIYVAVPAVTMTSTLMLFLDVSCGGVENLATQEYFRRNIEFGGMSPNLLLRVSRTSPEPVVGYVDCVSPFNLIEDGKYQSMYVQDGVNGGALEVAIPWDQLGDYERAPEGVRVPPGQPVLGVLAVITGGESTGAGDAAPDPSIVLENDSTRVAITDNHVRIPLDSDSDGILDMGISPRVEATYAVSADAQDTTVRQVFSLRIQLEKKLLSPSDGVPATFPVVLDTDDYTEPVYVTAKVFSSAGYAVRNLIDDQPVDFSQGEFGIEWDFKDDRGDTVGGGVYIIAVSGGAGSGSIKNTARASFAVIR